jgi:hypothetical protein
MLSRQPPQGQHQDRDCPHELGHTAMVIDRNKLLNTLIHPRPDNLISCGGEDPKSEFRNPKETRSPKSENTPST